MKSALEAQQVLRWLMIVRWIALADLVLLIVLLVASFANNEKMVQIFGLTHGIVFLALIAIVGIGAVQKLWTWWFLVGTLVTTGPPGALVGEVLIARKAKAILVASKGETTDPFSSSHLAAQIYLAATGSPSAGPIFASPVSC